MARKMVDPNTKTVADNRRARYEYHVGDVIQAGVMLHGTEVKALREGKANIAEAYCSPESGPNGAEFYLINANIPEYSGGNRENHLPKRNRKLLLHKRQVATLTGAVERKGYTVVPLKLYFDPKGRVKLDIALAEGKQNHDKRATEKKRDWDRQKQRLLRQ